MKNLISKFADSLLSKEELVKIKGGYGCGNCLKDGYSYLCNRFTGGLCICNVEGATGC